MGSIGPNFRPSGQPGPTSGVRGNSDNPNAQPQPNQSGSSAPHSAGPPGTLPLASLLANQTGLQANQLAQLLRNLLQLPREIVQLMALLAELDPKAGQEMLQKLLQEEVKVPLEDLQQLMKGRLDKAQDKLIQLLQSSPATLAGSGGEMGELMNGLSELAAKTGKSPAEALQSTLTLYLPFYPLHPPQAFSLRFEPPQGDDEGGGEQAPQLVVYIETLTLGHFRASILTQSQGRWQAIVEHDALANAFTAELEQALKAAAPLEKPELLFLPRPGSTALSRNQPSEAAIAAPSTPTAKQSVGLHPTGGVSVLAVHAAYLLIRVILELDNQQALQSHRATQV